MVILGVGSLGPVVILGVGSLGSVVILGVGSLGSVVILIGVGSRFRVSGNIGGR